MKLVPMSLDADEVELFYEGIANATIWPIYHDLVAKPEFHREWWDSYVKVNRRFAQKAADLASEGAHGVGARLPAAARAADAARAAPRPAHRLLPPHPVPAGRAVPAAALAPAGARGSARRRPGGLPAAGRRRQLRAPRATAGGPQDPPRPRLPARRPHREGRGVPHLDRRQGVRGPRPDRRRGRARQGDPRGAGQPAQDLPRHRPARLHEGHLRAAARLQRAHQGRPPRRRGRRLRAGGRAVARAGGAVPHPPRRHRPAGRSDQRRPRADRPPRHQLPALLLPARGDGGALHAPPTSWSSRRTATA